VAKAKKVEKTNNKNLITIVLLIVAGIVILSYTNNIGNVAKGDVAKLSITKSEGSSTVTMKIDSGYYGVNRFYEVFGPNNEFVYRSTLCNTNTLCKGSSIKRNIGIQQSWRKKPGIYTVKVRDINREKAGEDPYITATFRVP